MIKAVRSVSKQGQLQPRCHPKARSLITQLLNGQLDWLHQPPPPHPPVFPNTRMIYLQEITLGTVRPNGMVINPVAVY